MLEVDDAYLSQLEEEIKRGGVQDNQPGVVTHAAWAWEGADQAKGRQAKLIGYFAQE